MTLVALATALALAAPPAAPGPGPAIATPKIAFQRFVLPNGLVLIVHEDPKAPIVAVNVWYHVGSKNERPGKTGFAHLFEHLMFNGSEHFDDDWFKVLERIGGTDLNGTTNRDRTNYFQNVPTPALDTVLWMESDRMGHLLGAVTQARLDEQRGVVKNERRQSYENAPYGRAWEALSAGSFPVGHPYSWTTIGSMQDLDAATLDDVKDWFKEWYGAANAVIVVAGDVKAADVKARVEKYFGNIPSGPPLTRQEAWIAKRTGEHRQAMADRVPQARVYLSWNTPTASSPDSEDLELAARILSSGKSSRLYKRLVYDGQIATDASASQMAGEIAGQFLITATARPGGELAPVEAAAREELARFLEKGPTQVELDRARTELLAAFTRGVERIGGFGGKSDVLAQGEVYGGRPDFYEERLARLRAATPARVQAAARRWLSDGVFVLEITPWKEGKVSGAEADRAKIPDAGTPPAPQVPRGREGRPRQRAADHGGLPPVGTGGEPLPRGRRRLLLRPEGSRRNGPPRRCPHPRRHRHAQRPPDLGRAPRPGRHPVRELLARLDHHLPLGPQVPARPVARALRRRGAPSRPSPRPSSTGSGSSCSPPSSGSGRSRAPWRDASSRASSTVRDIPTPTPPPVRAPRRRSRPSPAPTSRPGIAPGSTPATRSWWSSATSP